MPFTYEVDPRQEMIFIRASGRITDHELLAFSQGIAADPRYHHSLRFIRDNAGVTKDEITPEGFRTAAAILTFPLTTRVVPPAR